MIDPLLSGLRPHRLLITGAGGPSAISAWKALRQTGLTIYMADMDPEAAGLYLVPPSARIILPAARDPHYLAALHQACATHGVTLVLPTVDAEMPVIQADGPAWTAQGVTVLASSLACLDLCQDKAALLTACAAIAPVPVSEILTAAWIDAGWTYPVFVKPRTGAGSRGAVRCDTRAEVAACPRDGSCVVQEFLPGTEYSVDVFISQAGHVLAAVPRVRLRIDSGIAVAARSVAHPVLEAAASRVAERIGATGVINVQFREDRAGTPKLLEVNARIPGTMPVTGASGINMPRLAVLDALGAPMPTGPLPFTPVHVVRYLVEIVRAADDPMPSAPPVA